MITNTQLQEIKKHLPDSTMYDGKFYATPLVTNPLTNEFREVYFEKMVTSDGSQKWLCLERVLVDDI